MPKKQILKFISNSPLETQKMASEILTKFKNFRTICLFGNLGSGKTTFVQGVGEALGFNKRHIKSPTYIFCHEYKKPGLILYHYDLYRLESPREIYTLGFTDMINTPSNLIIIEWAEKLGEYLPPSRLDVYFKIKDEQKREITVYPYSKRGWSR